MSAENPKIGLDNVVIAQLLTDDGIHAPTYGTPIALKGAVNATVNPNSSVETDYADNGAFFVTGNRANAEMTLELTNVAPATLALMLGQERANGITVEKPLDQAPYFAMGFRVWIGGTDAEGNKIFEYFWYAKGKFSVPETGGTTKKDTIDFQHVNLTAQFISTLYQPDGNSGVICTHCRSDIDTTSATISAWFNSPVLVTSADVSELSVVIAKVSTTKISITGSKESGTASDIDPNSAVIGRTVIVTDADDGTAIAGSLSVEDNVVTFTASATMSGDVVVSVVGLKDVYGCSVTAVSVVNIS